MKNRAVKPKKIRRSGKADYLILSCIFVLTIFGLAMLASASSYVGKVRFGDTYFYLKHQLLSGLSFGIIGFIFGAQFYYRRYEKLAIFLLLASIVLLVLIFTPFGLQAKGASRWLTFGPVTFQPSEILKITFLAYLAAWLSRGSERQKNFLTGFVPFLIISIVITGLLLAQHSTSIVALLMAVAMIVYFVSGAKLTYIASGTLVVIAILSLVIYFTPYRLNRIMSFVRGEADIQASGFQLNQALIAIGSGGLTGVGYGQSTSKISYLPESIGDSIFAVIAEELGFIGVSLMLLVFSVLILKIFLLAHRIRDRFGQLLLIGFGSLIGLQTFMNIAALSGIVPLTGLPLPFISYGGTALAVFMTIGGIIVNISKYS